MRNANCETVDVYSCLCGRNKDIIHFYYSFILAFNIEFLCACITLFRLNFIRPNRISSILDMTNGISANGISLS